MFWRQKPRSFNYLGDQFFAVGEMDLAILAHVNELTLFLLFRCGLICGRMAVTVSTASIRRIFLVYELDINSAHLFLSSLFYFNQSTRV